MEGPNNDHTGSVTNPITGTTTAYLAGNPNDLMGDSDDVLALTVRSQGEPFVANVNGTMMESQIAEVIWFAVPNGRSIPTNGGNSIQLSTLYRRVLLVAPSISLAGAVPTLFANFDVSARTDITTGNAAPNTLGDLTDRRNRYWHFATGPGPAGFPFPLGNGTLNASTFAVANSARLGEDVILSDVLAFDVRLFDPLAPLASAADGSVVGPSDVGYPGLTTAAANPIAKGAFVDLGFANMAGSYFSALAHAASKLTIPTYDTWSMGYEQDGILQGSASVDQGTNGLDDDLSGVVDDPPQIDTTSGSVISIGERETLPPYPFPLRGIQVKIRVYEPDSRQVREVTIVQDFLPE